MNQIGRIGDVRMEQQVDLTLLRRFPPVHQVLNMTAIKDLATQYGEPLVSETVRQVINKLKDEIVNNKESMHDYLAMNREDIIDSIIAHTAEQLKRQGRRGLQRVINATGIILHTNLGRAPLPLQAINAITNVAAGYSNLEYSLETGKRGDRQESVRALLQRITGAEDGFVVNNNAAAVFLMLNTLAEKKQVIVSRGEQVEIGGSFRIPDIIVKSGATMVEVGTTNKTKLSDYERAINEDTAVLMKIHTSNYKIIGFEEHVELQELASLAAKHRILLIEDLGSGNLINLPDYGLSAEPTVSDSIRKGADLVSFSGDKLLGGPQAGIIVGKKELIAQIRRNPLARMVRVDKMTLAALEAVLELYRNLDYAVHHIPVLEMLTMREEELAQKALQLKTLLDEVTNGVIDVRIEDEYDEPGGGSLPGLSLKGKVIAITADYLQLEKLQAFFREWEIPIITRISKDALLISVRTLFPVDYPEIAACLKEYIAKEMSFASKRAEG